MILMKKHQIYAFTVPPVAFFWKKNNGSIIAIHYNHLSTPFYIFTMESADLCASYLVSSMSFGVDYLGQCILSKY